ncbi:MAG: glycosyl hydrolase family 32, partial [Clostridia bacterium]|nr:glycosyl hydrolase family 32 [Clostridia bacterium]
ARLLTRPLCFTGNCLFVNGDFHNGFLRVGVSDENGNSIPGFSAEECIPMCENSTIARITWKNRPTLRQLEGRIIRLAFEGKNGQLYSFWVADDDNGHSRGYLAAGSVGQGSVTDVKTSS